MGRSTVEREGVSVAHAARLILVGTMNPEEGELRPQLLDRFGLTVEIAAPREPELRAEVVRRRMAYDADPDTFVARFADDEAALQTRIAAARKLVSEVRLSDWALTKIAVVCAGFEVDGMRADLVTARGAVAHAAWHGRTDVTRADIRAAARLALPHRRRRNPFDAPGLDEELLDRLLGDDDHDPEPDESLVSLRRAGHQLDALRQAQRTGHPGARRRAAGRRPTEARRPEPVEGPATIAPMGEPYRARVLRARGQGYGTAGRRSRAITSVGRTVRASAAAEDGCTCPPRFGRRRGSSCREDAAAGALRFTAGRSPARRARGPRGEPRVVLRGRVRLDGRPPADGGGEDRGAVAAAGRLPASGQGRAGHVPRHGGHPGAAGHLLGGGRRPAAGRPAERWPYAAGRGSALRGRDPAGRRHPGPPAPAAAGGGHRRSGDRRRGCPPARPRRPPIICVGPESLRW